MQQYMAYLIFITRNTYIHASLDKISKWSDQQEKNYMQSTRDHFQQMFHFIKNKTILGFQIMFNKNVYPFRFQEKIGALYAYISITSRNSICII